MSITQRALPEREAATYIGMSVSYLRRGRLEGSGSPTPPYVRIGRSVRYLREDLDLWLDGLRGPTHSEQPQKPASF